MFQVTGYEVHVRNIGAKDDQPREEWVPLIGVVAAPVSDASGNTGFIITVLAVNSIGQMVAMPMQNAKLRPLVPAPIQAARVE